MIAFLLAFSAVVTAVGVYPYVVSTIKRAVRPRLVTWGVWLVLALVMTSSSVIEGHIASAVLSATCLLSCVVVFVVGWKSGSRSVSRLDIACLIGAGIGIVSLVVFKNPAAALLIAIAVDGIAFIPTIVHGWQNPYEEGMACYLCNVGAGILVLSAALFDSAGFTGVVYPLYSILFNGVMTAIIMYGRETIRETQEYSGVDA